MTSTSANRRSKKECGARRKHGMGRCRRAPMPNGRCYLHGGPMRGFVQIRNKDPTKANAARLARQAIRRYLGIKAPWGQRKGGSAYVKITAEGKCKTIRELRFMADELVPLVRHDVALVDMNHAELLARAAHSGLVRLIEVIERTRDPDDAKGERLSAEMSAVSARLYAQVQEAALRGQRSDQLSHILRTIVEQAE